MVTLHEGFTQWEIIVNPDLQPLIFSTPLKLERKGVKWLWGRDKQGGRAIMYAFYPKKMGKTGEGFTKEDMLRIVKKYGECPNCKIKVTGEKFKKMKNNHKIMVLKNFSFVNTIQKIPVIGKPTRTGKFGFAVKNPQITERWLMSLISNGLRNFINFGFEPLAAKFVNFLIGAAGTWGTTRLAGRNSRLANELLTFFANWGASLVDPTPQEVMRIADNIRELKTRIKARQYGAAFNALVRPSIERKAAMQSLREAIGFSLGKLNFSGLKNFFGKIGLKGRLWQVPTTHGNPKFDIKYSDDYGYIDNKKWFRDVSKFGPSFITKKRLSIAGVNQG